MDKDCGKEIPDFRIGKNQPKSPESIISKLNFNYRFIPKQGKF